MFERVPSFNICVKEAEKRLSRLLNGECRISVYYELDENQKNIIQKIDHQKFRQELQYTRDELYARSNKKGFLCLIAFLNGEGIAFDYGYDDEEEGCFYSDNTATLIEGKRIGSTLFALEIIHSYHHGYKSTKHSTEEFDEKGRPLMVIWSKLGFKEVSSDSLGNIEMMLTHTTQNIRSLFDEYILNKE